MLRAVVSEIAPVPEVTRSLPGLGRSIVPEAKTASDLSAARVAAPMKVTVLNSLPDAPIDMLEVRSGMLNTVNVSAALPGLIVTDPVGLAKSVASKVAPLKRHMP